MRIREIRAVGLRGATPEGGWEAELQPEDCIHTLIAVVTDEGLTGLGSVFTSDDLVRASPAVLDARHLAVSREAVALPRPVTPVAWRLR